MTEVLRPQHRLPRGGGNCDFCGAPHVVMLHACRNFRWEDRPVFNGPVGRWASCQICAYLVEDGKRTKLTNRVMREVSKRRGLSPEDLVALRITLKVLHAELSKHLIPHDTLFVHVSKYRRISTPEAPNAADTL
jgi:hypothetical protein